MIKLRTCLVSLLFWVVSFIAPVFAQIQPYEEEVIADLSDHLVAIDAGFKGKKVLLFGTTSGEGDVVITIRGPARNQLVRKKERHMGIWMNSEQMIFDNNPSFYSVATNRPISELVQDDLAKQFELGVENLRPNPRSDKISDEELSDYWQALLRNKQREGLYVKSPERVSFLGNRLFRADIHFPSNVPVGTYLVDVYLVNDKQIVSAQSTPLVVSKIGVEAGIFEYAHRFSFVYGVMAVLVACLAGWLASVVFRKG